MPQSILGNTFIATFGRVVNTALGVVAISLLSRLLGATAYGLYVLLFSYATLFQIAADFGLYLTLTRNLGRQTNDRAFIVRHTAGLRIFLLLVSFTFSILIALWIPGIRSNLPSLILVALGLSFQSLSQLVMSVFQFQATIWRATISDLLGRGVQIGGLLLIAWMHPQNILELSIAWFAASSFVSYAANWLLLSDRSWLKPKFSWSVWKVIFKETWPFALLLALNVIYFRIDVLMLSFWRSTQEVGWYGLAYRIIESGLFFPAMIGGLLLPRLVAAFRVQDMATIRALIEQTIYVMLLVAGLIITLLTHEASGIISLISGASYLSAAPLLTILSWALVIMLFGNMAGFGLVAFDRQRVLIYLYGSLVAVNIAGNFLVIPSYGAIGAAWMTVVTEGISTLVALVAVWNICRFKIDWWFLCRVLVVAGAVNVFWRALPEYWPFLIRAACMSALYGVLSISVGLLKRKYYQILITRPI